MQASADQATCDVVVVGGGTAGVVAAIQAGRLGAKTILVETGSQMGGAATVGGVNSPILFNAHGAPRIRGIGWEWVVKTVKLDNGEMPESRQHWRINAPLFAIMAEELSNKRACRSATSRHLPGSRRTRSSPIAGRSRPRRWAKRGRIHCKQLVDCTGNGAACALRPARSGMRETEIMPGSHNYTITHAIDTKKLDKAAVEKKFAEAVATGDMLASDARHGILSSLGYQAGNYVLNADNSTAEARTDTNLRGRQSVLRMLRFIRSLPGGETAQLVAMSPEVGVARNLPGERGIR
jgi:glycine/D-amino acid oxidase-like deaminating enzyme